MIWWVSVFGGLAKKLTEAYVAKEDALTSRERISADVQIKQLEARQAAVISGGRWIAPIQALFALIFLIYWFKVIIWDKVLGLGVTDGLSDGAIWLQNIVIGFCFLQSGISRIIK